MPPPSRPRGRNRGHSFRSGCAPATSQGREAPFAAGSDVARSGWRAAAGGGGVDRWMPDHPGLAAVVVRLRGRDLPLFVSRPWVPWDEALRAEIEAEGLGLVPGDAAVAIRAGLHLWNDDLAASHALSQHLAGPTGSYWHGLMHRREGDLDNAAYPAGGRTSGVSRSAEESPGPGRGQGGGGGSLVRGAAGGSAPGWSLEPVCLLGLVPRGRWASVAGGGAGGRDRRAAGLHPGDARVGCRGGFSGLRTRGWNRWRGPRSVAPSTLSSDSQ